MTLYCGKKIPVTKKDVRISEDFNQVIVSDGQKKYILKNEASIEVQNDKV